MERLYNYFHEHKWLMYTLLVLTVVLFAVLAFQCRFEENIAKLLAPTSDNLTVDLAFSNLKVKDKIFIQITSKDASSEADDVMLSEAMDKFMEILVADDEKKGYVGNTLYQIDFEELLSAAPWLVEHAPSYLDFTDAEMDSLTTVEHISEQIEQYLSFMETDMVALLIITILITTLVLSIWLKVVQM